MQKKVREVTGNINSQQPCHLITHVPVTEEDLLCSVLGLKESVARRLASLSSRIRNHQSDMYFLKQFLADHEENCGFDESLSNVEAVASKLQEIGFTANRSVVIAEWIAKQPLADHQSLLAWAQHYIESLFTYDILLNDHVSKYPYRETKLNSWFSITVERENKDGAKETNVQVINTTHEKVTWLIEEEERDRKKQQLEACFYYHGTDHKSAKSILEEGIKLKAGSPECDFSNGYGFYLTDNDVYALDWAREKSKAKAGAVLIFNITKDCFNKYCCLDLTLHERRDWQKVIDYFRKKNQNIKNKENRILYRDCKKCDYIKGPISRDGTDRDTQQICIKKDDMADCIGNAANICGVIFFAD